MRIQKLLRKNNKSGGRNNQGVITAFHRGGGNSKLYRIIDFKRSLFNISARVEKLEYDPNRSSKIALVCYKNGMLSYILAPNNLMPGDEICSSSLRDVEISVGNSVPLRNIPIGTIIHNIELKPGRGGQLMRAAGTYAKMVSIRRGKWAAVRLHSGKLYSLSTQAMATIGMLSPNSKLKLRKAGESRWKGRRPVVRGVAMNPIDHPHGGGEGRSKGGRHPVTPWGKLTKGKRTSRARSAKKYLESNGKT